MNYGSSRDFTAGTAGVPMRSIKIQTALEGRKILRIGYAKTLRTWVHDVAGSEAGYPASSDLLTDDQYALFKNQKGHTNRAFHMNSIRCSKIRV